MSSLVCGTFFFLVDGALRAADIPRPLDIRVKPAGFGTASSADLALLLQSAAFELWRYCAQTHLGGIDVYHRADHPQTNFGRTATGRIAIGIAAQDTHWRNSAFSLRMNSVTHWPTSAIDRCGQRVFHLKLISGWKRVCAKRLRCLLCGR
jgi:hypothetical protein